jgi:hypothetical protein
MTFYFNREVRMQCEKTVYVCMICIYVAAIAVGCAPSTSVRTETQVQENSGGGKDTQTALVNDKVVADLKTEWQTENLVATGSAPLVKKYSDPARDKELARRAAILDAQHNLANQVSTIRISATTVMSDLMASEFVKSQVDALLKDVTVLSETFVESSDRWDVTVQMPKVNLIKAVEEYRRR